MGGVNGKLSQREAIFLGFAALVVVAAAVVAVVWITRSSTPPLAVDDCERERLAYGAAEAAQDRYNESYAANLQAYATAQAEYDAALRAGEAGRRFPPIHPRRPTGEGLRAARQDLDECLLQR